MVLKLYTEEQLIEKFGHLVPKHIIKDINTVTSIMEFNGINIKQFHDRYVIAE